MSSKWLASAWLLCCVLMCVVLAYQVNKGFLIETNVLALLPATEQDPVAEKAVSVLSENIGQRMMFLVGGENREEVRKVAFTVQSQLQAQSCFGEVNLTVDSSVYDRLHQILLPYRQFLLTERTRQSLSTGEEAAVIAEAKSALFSPMKRFSQQSLEHDPLFLFSDFTQSLKQNSGNVSFDADMLSIEKDNAYYVLLHTYLAGDAFSVQTQSCAMNAINTVRDNLEKNYTGIELKTSGLVRYAAAGTESARSEISTIGVGSIIAIIIILVLVFGSVLPLFVGLLPIVMGILAALVFSSYIFEKVHLFTLVFGTSLIGIAIDYSLHFLTMRLMCENQWDSQQGLRRIFAGISLGLASSVIGYMSFFATSFPGLTQVAVFSSTGLIAAYLTVVAWFPLLLSRPSTKQHKALHELSASWLKLNDQFKQSKLFWPFIIVLIILIGGGLASLKPNDDVRMLQSTPAELQLEDRQVAELIGRHDAAQFFLVEGKSEQTVLENEERLREHLDALVEQGSLVAYTATSNFIPSFKRQQENQTLIQQGLLNDDGKLVHYMQDLGFTEKSINELINDYQQKSEDYLRREDVVSQFSGKIPFPEFLWIGATERGVASIVSLVGVRDMQLFRDAAENLPEITFVDKVENISTMFKRYRVASSYYIACTYVLIIILLIFRYRVKRALLIVFPPIAAALLSLAIQGYMGEPLNLFNSLALLLVLGIGIDYTLFFEEGKSLDRSPTMLAVILSALTTMISFGLLALSSTQAIHGFGLTVLFGIGFAFLLSPMVSQSSTKS